MSSKYDAVKVRVFVQDEHYYILSRFRLSRMLTFCRVPTTAAVQIALDLKRCFVNDGRTSVTQTEMEAALRVLMRAHGFGPAHLDLLSVMSTFYMQRVPLVLLIAGDARDGTTVLAQRVACKLNCLTVLSTDLLLDMTDTLDALQANTNADSDDSDEAATPIGGATVSASATTAPTAGTDVAGAERGRQQAWQQRCACVRGAVVAELEHALRDGKVAIVEGQWLNVELYADYLQTGFQRTRGAIVLAVRLHPSSAARRLAGGCDYSCCGSASPPCDQCELADAMRGGVTGRLSAYGPNQALQSQHATLQTVPLSFCAARGDCATTSSLPPIASHDGRGDEATVYDVYCDHPAALARVADCLHDIIVDRIMRELAARGISVGADKGHE